MNLTKKSNEDNSMALFQREINDLVENFWQGHFLPTLGQSQFAEVFNLKINVCETEKDIQITAELPGIDEKDFEVLLLEDTICIRGEKKKEKEEKGKNYHRLEHSYGSFERHVPLPAEVLADKIDASFKKGVLKICMIKNEKTAEKAKKIEIKG